ncbi:hypothetical protein PG995_012110 [Apiospora arundinis]
MRRRTSYVKDPQRITSANDRPMVRMSIRSSYSCSRARARSCVWGARECQADAALRHELDERHVGLVDQVERDGVPLLLQLVPPEEHLVGAHVGRDQRRQVRPHALRVLAEAQVAEHVVLVRVPGQHHALLLHQPRHDARHAGSACHRVPQNFGHPPHGLGRAPPVPIDQRQWVPISRIPLAINQDVSKVVDHGRIVRIATHGQLQPRVHLVRQVAMLPEDRGVSGIDQGLVWIHVRDCPIVDIKTEEPQPADRDALITYVYSIRRVRQNILEELVAVVHFQDQILYAPPGGVVEAPDTVHICSDNDGKCSHAADVGTIVPQQLNNVQTTLPESDGDGPVEAGHFPCPRGIYRPVQIHVHAVTAPLVQDSPDYVKGRASRDGPKQQRHPFRLDLDRNGMSQRLFKNHRIVREYVQFVVAAMLRAAVVALFGRSIRRRTPRASARTQSLGADGENPGRGIPQTLLCIEAKMSEKLDEVLIHLVVGAQFLAGRRGYIVLEAIRGSHRSVAEGPHLLVKGVVGDRARRTRGAIIGHIG